MVVFFPFQKKSQRKRWTIGLQSAAMLRIESTCPALSFATVNRQQPESENLLNLSEVAQLLGLRREQVRTAIDVGLQLPNSGTVVKLVATQNGLNVEVSAADLDEFIRRFEAEVPGRHPPMDIRRVLLVEASHRCAICRNSAPLQYHHMLEWSRIKAHDANHMLAVCGTCHDKCTNGTIDYKSQQMYKNRLVNNLVPNSEARSGGITTTTREVNVELVIDAHFDEFTDEEQEHLLQAIGEILRVTKKISVVSKRDGSVRLTIRLPVPQAEELVALIRAGGLTHLDIVDAHVQERLTTSLDIEVPQWDTIGKPQFGKLVDSLNPSAKSYALRILHNEADADDAVQESFMRAWEGLEQFNASGGNNFRAWYFTILRKTCINLIRSRRQRRIEKEDDPEVVDLEDVPEGSVLDPLAAVEIVEMISEAITKLPEQYRTVLVMRYFMGLTTSEIADVLSVPRSQVYIYSHRALTMLRELANQKPG